MNEWTQRAEPAWGAVFSMTLGVFGLVTAEFLPASLLTPMAEALGITEGLAGQAVTATAAVALVTSLLITAVTRHIDRRLVLLAFSALLVASNLLVAFAPNLVVLLFGRVLLGLALGGFWTMSAATVMRLVPEALVPRALSMIFSGVSVATIVAAPLGSYFGDIVGWRNVFLMAAVLGLVALVVQFMTLPRMAPSGLTSLRTLVEVLMRPRVGLGMVSAALVFTGHFAFFTYIRPFLETVTGVGVSGVSGILLGFGIANFLGTFLGGLMLERSMRLTLIVMPLLMGILGLGLVGIGGAPLVDSVMVALWGLAFGAIPVAWSTWLTRTVPDEAESAGGLLVAAIQFAIATGAAAGGAIFDVSGATGVFTVSGFVLLLAALVILVGVRPRPVVATI
ncbi:major facilitator transporter [Litchfieldella anticariensis FP35 = DSM 16096]|uniref:Major facilitator transporter n=1 Tax=Litchfieldella anticariensis (strain DSM 16096 / CECT 5854 / CIP 108499 / LMG 22089 / FP35) TaxID=1121939 RepID=S2LCY8_LITA3|nr:MFS transporter [Halomonas anticariensis]EPC02656.1 major facilitator transporter [Halomonas anticariensis FP35 = DSM 16096]